MAEDAVPRVVNVLIIEDELGEEFVNAFRRLNEGEYPLPEGVAQPGGTVFEPALCKDPKGISAMLLGTPSWDAFVLDRKLFDKGNRWGLRVLQSLNDLQVGGVKIVCTAYFDPDDLIKCMRLGAWDYIDKINSRYGDPITDVVVSVIRGLEQLAETAEKGHVDQEGHAFVAEHYVKIYHENKGNFLALEKQDAPKEWSIVAKDESLFGLHLKLEEGGWDRQKVHITLIQK